VLKLLPGVEDVLGELESVERERLLRAEAEVGVEGEVAPQVRPADLPPLRLEAVVGGEAVRADDTGRRAGAAPESRFFRRYRQTFAA
jgi:hypothetical protein